MPKDLLQSLPADECKGLVAVGDDPRFMMNLFHDQQGELEKVGNELAESKAAPKAVTQKALNSVQVTPKDVVLETFCGSKNPDELKIEKELFLLVLICWS
jgi:hypothetical protein